MQKECGYELEVVEKECYEGREISSSYVKEALAKGNMELVNTLLGYPYTVQGEVLHGRRIGRTLGMPTTNIIPSVGKLLPPNGVYASKTIIQPQTYGADEGTALCIRAAGAEIPGHGGTEGADAPRYCLWKKLFSYAFGKNYFRS